MSLLESIANRPAVKDMFEKIYKGFYAKDITYANQYPSKVNNFLKNLPDTKQGNMSYGDFLNFVSADTVNREAYYSDYDVMDTDIIASALDLFADDSTQYDLDSGDSFKIQTNDISVTRELEDLFFNVLNINEHIWDIARTTAKYGDFFVKLKGEQGKGVESANYSIHPSRVDKISKGGVLQNFIVDKRIQLSPWDMVHFKLAGSIDREMRSDEYNYVQANQAMPAQTEEELDNALVYDYGMSTLYRAREDWKKLKLVEDSLVMSRLTRSAKRNIFAVNTSGLKEPEAMDLINKIQKLLKRATSTNTIRHQMNIRNLNMEPDEDIVVPVNGEKGSFSINELGGDVDIKGIVDVDYLVNKLFADLKIPKSYLGFEDALNGRNTLRMLDVRYARTIKNLQRVLMNGLLRIAKIHISYKGYDPYSYDIRILFPYVSTIEESERIETISTNIDAMTKLADLLNGINEKSNSVDFNALTKVILKNIKLSDDDISAIINKNKSQDLPEEGAAEDEM